MTKSMSNRSIRLERAVPDDAARLVQVIDPKALQNFSMFASGRPLTVEEERMYLQRMSGPTDKLFLVFVNKSSRLIGTTGLHEIDTRMHTARIGTIIFNPRDRGHHYGTKAMEMTLDYGFYQLGLNKIYGQTFVHNKPVLQLHKHLGFVHEGILRQEYYLRGEYYDMVRESILHSEWEQRLQQKGDHR
jgi:RimJ/RimL family protein N-acetyltransferase